LKLLCFALLALTVASVGAADDGCVGNLGYNSYESYMSGGVGLNKYFGPGPGYPTNTGDYFRRYIPPDQWGKVGFGTGHLNEGYGPYVFGPKDQPSPPGLFDPLPGAYRDAPPPLIKIRRGNIRVALPPRIPGIRCVTVTLLAFNGAELVAQSRQCAPFEFNLPVMDGCKSVRVRIDYINEGLSATAYPL